MSSKRAKTPEEHRLQRLRKSLAYRFVLQRGDETVTVYSEALARALVRHSGYTLVKRQRRRERTGGAPDLNESNWTDWYEENRRLLPPERG